MAPLPLEGIRIVDLTVVWAGPFACALLGDLGAEVIKVESLQRPDPMTRIPRDPVEMRKRVADVAPDAKPWNVSSNFNTVGRNRKSVTMDLNREEGREAFYRLIALSDIFIENNAPSTVEKLRIDYPTLTQHNPQLIMASMSAFGADGPYRDYRAFGANIEAVVGYLLLRGYAAGEEFVNSAGGFSDACGGALAAMAILAALNYRSNTGFGQYIDMAQSEGVAQTLGQAMMDFSMNGRSRLSTGNRDPDHVPQGVYRCLGKDSWVAVSCGNDEEFRALCGVIGRPEYAADPKFAAGARHEQHDLLDRDITSWTSQRDHYEAFHMLQAAGVPAGPVLDQAQMFADPHLHEREDWLVLKHPAAGTHSYLKSPIWHMSETPLRYRNPAPTLGQDNEYVYREVLGFSDAEYKRFEELGHIGTDYEQRR
jgi:crotonobetainyl-CoA:carnitine CoA-transferase CaiB-like acyl-CoA transferase